MDMNTEHRLLCFTAGELPKTGEPERHPNTERPRTAEERAAERLRRISGSITPENAEAIVRNPALAEFRNETVTPEILRARQEMVERTRQDIVPMLLRLDAALRSAGLGSPEANAVLREITDRLHTALGPADGRASTRAENDARALADALNGMVIGTGEKAGQQRIGVQVMTDRDGRWGMTVRLVEALR